MRRFNLEEIAEAVGRSVRTVQSSATEGKWKEERAARQITDSSLVPKILGRIDEILSEEHFDGKSADQLSKVVKLLEQIDKRTSVVEVVDVFLAFGGWLERRAVIDRELTDELRKKVDFYQDRYVTERINHGQ